MSLAVTLVLAALAQAQTFTTLYNFTGGSDGGWLPAGVVQDSFGNLYGTTHYGGNSRCYDDYQNGCGVVFQLNTDGKETALHVFCSRRNCADGAYPSAPIVRDKTGNIYGTTFYGGSGSGVVFEVDAAGKETVLHTFTGPDGCNPWQGLVRDEAGNLYGTASGCGSTGEGTIFKLDAAKEFTILHNFTAGLSDGGRPAAGHLTIDNSGNLYGLTLYGGTYNDGVLYKLSKEGAFTVLHSFVGGRSDGCYPLGSVLQDRAGSFYGTTSQCGSYNYGTIWKVSAQNKETILHSFGGADGAYPYAGVARDSKGNLFGVAEVPGDLDESNPTGTLYELSVKGKLTLLHTFDGPDGAYVLGEVLRTNDGTLFGTAEVGGTYGVGTVWKYVH